MPGSVSPAPTERCRLLPHPRSATDGVPAPAACICSSGPRRYRNGALWCAGQSLPDTVFRSFPLPHHRRNAGSTLATEPRLVHPRAPGWDGKPAGRSGGPVCGLAAAGWLLVCRGNAVRPGACWRATRLPVLGADVRFPVSASRSPASLDPDLVLEQTRCSQVAYLRRACRLVSSNPTVAEAAAFVQRNLPPTKLQGLSR